MELRTTILDLVTATVAVAALVLSAVNFRLTGSRVKVKARGGMHIYMSAAKNNPMS